MDDRDVTAACAAAGPSPSSSSDRCSPSDPIFYRYTVVGPRKVEVRTDTTHDQNGTPAVTTERCTSLAVVDHFLTAEECAPA